MPFDVISGGLKWQDEADRFWRCKSAEHEVSLRSQRRISWKRLDKSASFGCGSGIDKQGLWHINDAGNHLLNAQDPARIALLRPPR
ncbi:hypothetical protein MJ585_06155 [Klebsiella pneumoniae]|nr:hypothetical protein MJ585_06155 [Klebsiella pneumoniae]